MKIVKRKDFVKLPDGTVYSEYEPCSFGPLMIKGETINNGGDWFEQQIADAIDCSGSDDFTDLLFAAQDEGTSVKMNFYCEGRNGLFDDDDRLYAVWERGDVCALIDRLHACISPPALEKQP